uniref:Reverse transcriptase zinc-binding domain-containing protein n=1 Tax=Davidia involucrata TaxID=16924 RepID=A0A5B7BQ21_DAVIN
MAREGWNLLLSLFGFEWVMPNSIKNLFFCWGGVCVRKDVKKIWKVAPLCLVSCLWRERNSRTFDGKEQSIPTFKNSVLSLLHFWIKESFPCHVDSILDFVGSLRQ